MDLMRAVSLILCEIEIFLQFQGSVWRISTAVSRVNIAWLDRDKVEIFAFADRDSRS